MPQRIDVPGMGVVEFPDGMSDEQIGAAIKKNIPASVDTTKDVIKSAAAGIGKGAISTAGLVGDLGALAARGIDAGAKKIGLNIPSLEAGREKLKSLPALPGPLAVLNAPGSEDINKLVKPVTGEFHKPETRAGRYAETVGEFVPGMVAGPGGLMRRAITNVALPGIASETAGQITEGTKAEPYARVAGALTGAVLPSVAARAITPLPANPARQRLVDILNQEGVTSLTAGQRTGSNALRYAESALGDVPGAGGPTANMTRRGVEQFTEAAMRRAGAGPNAGPEVLSANQRRLGDAFTDLSARNSLTMDQQFANDIRGVIRDYGRVLPSEQRERVYNVITDLAQQGNTIPGEVYQATRSRLNRVANNARTTDPDFGQAIRGIRNALDDAMARSVAPADRGAWEAARREYSAQKVIEKTASRAGEATGEGMLVPSNLRNTVAAENRGAYARGEGPFSELARAGSTIMSPMPQSGTAPRAAMHAIASMLGGTLGMPGGPVGTGAGASLGALVGPALAGRALMSRPVQGYLGNQVMTPAMQNMNPREAAILSALIAAEQQRLAAPQQ